jgi:hypothetical protein
VEGATVEPTTEFAQLQLGFVDQTQWRFELIRPLVLFANRTAQQREEETDTHPDTVRKLQRRFRQQVMPGLLPDHVEVVIRRRATPIPDPVRQEIDRLKALYDGFHYRELARILFIKFGTPVDHKTVKAIWHESAVADQVVCWHWEKLTRRGGDLRRFYTQPHQFYCDIDVHARSMDVCLLNQDGDIVGHRHLPSSPEALLKTIAPYREHMVIAVVCIFTVFGAAT